MNNFPPFPSFAPLALDHGPALTSVLDRLSSRPSEFTFANLFVFRAAHRYEVSRWEGWLLIAARGYDGAPYGLPPLGGDGSPVPAARRFCEFLRGRGTAPVLFPVPSPWLGRWFSSPEWVSEPDRDQADYIYLRDDLARLAGRRYHKRRNRLLKFQREHAEGYRCETLRDDHVGACLALAEGWCDIRCSLERPSTIQETEAVREALRHRRALGLSGAVIELGGKVAAFCLGEPLGDDTFVVHFEKTEPGREGLAQLINRDFCRRELERFTFVNREQDLGDPGLRRAKEAYHPTLFLEKFRVRPAPGVP